MTGLLDLYCSPKGIVVLFHHEIDRSMSKCAQFNISGNFHDGALSILPIISQ